jgi:hypothetical protein
MSAVCIEYRIRSRGLESFCYGDSNQGDDARSGGRRFAFAISAFAPVRPQ